MYTYWASGHVALKVLGVRTFAFKSPGLQDNFMCRSLAAGPLHS